MGLKLRIGLMADFAAAGQRGKLTIVHVFNRFNPPRDKIGTPIGGGVLVVYLEGSLADGAQHSMTVKIRTADEEHLATEIQIEELPLAANGPGLPLSAQVLIGLAGIPMPDYGDYSFEVFADGESIGTIPFYVLPPVPSLGAPSGPPTGPHPPASAQ